MPISDVALQGLQGPGWLAPWGFGSSLSPRQNTSEQFREWVGTEGFWFGDLKGQARRFRQMMLADRRNRLTQGLAGQKDLVPQANSSGFDPDTDLSWLLGSGSGGTFNNSMAALQLLGQGRDQGLFSFLSTGEFK